MEGGGTGPPVELLGAARRVVVGDLLSQVIHLIVQVIYLIVIHLIAGDPS